MCIRDSGSREEYKYLLMLDMTLDELEDFYPDDEIIKEYGEMCIRDSLISISKSSLHFFPINFNLPPQLQIGLVIS